MIRLAILMLAIVLNASAQCVALCGTLPHAKPAPPEHCHKAPDQQDQKGDSCTHETFVSEQSLQTAPLVFEAASAVAVLDADRHVVTTVQLYLGEHSPPLLSASPLPLRI